jgi:hypothetical protein
MEKDIKYENNNKVVTEWTCPHPGIEDSGLYEIKCKNYELCRETIPDWWFQCKGNYLCTGCHMMFGTWKNEKAGVNQTGKGVLDISDNLDCHICLEVKRSISQPNCEHTLCINCFQRCYYGDQDTENEPKFPYPDIEDEYDENQENPKWDNDYPLIQIYNKIWNKWDDEKTHKYTNEEHLRKCPLCRK